ncbi:hypothetical protein ANN_11982 [Periplaneta americana]|uniref:Uncharacterized protein n=1 Tax=Periplaneta americana TaxID=6978 RepID=A0ABQ8T7Q6_PERAM|nr:hypothetical protein ANN_11982 [Periplaneta americana]
MSGSGSETETIQESNNDSQLKFVMLLAEHKILCSKSQLPKIRDEKERSVSVLRNEFLKHVGKDITEKQLKKKIQNMKTEVKKKTDKNATGNKKVVLKDCEKILLDLLSSDENPVFNKIPDKPRSIPELMERIVCIQYRWVFLKCSRGRMRRWPIDYICAFFVASDMFRTVAIINMPTISPQSSLSAVFLSLLPRPPPSGIAIRIRCRSIHIKKSVTARLVRHLVLNGRVRALHPFAVSLVSKNLKVRIYKTIILPVVLYGCETWTLTLREEHRLRVFENKVLREIFGAERDEVTGEWRKLHNTELHALYSSPDIIRNIKSRRLRWAGHVARMGESRNAYRVLVGRPEGKRPLGRPRRRWEDNIKMYLREVGYDDRDWINLAQDRDRWRAYVRAAMNLRVP